MLFKRSLFVALFFCAGLASAEEETGTTKTQFAGVIGPMVVGLALNRIVIGVNSWNTENLGSHLMTIGIANAFNLGRVPGVLALTVRLGVMGYDYREAIKNIYKTTTTGLNTAWNFATTHKLAIGIGLLVSSYFVGTTAGTGYLIWDKAKQIHTDE